MITLGIIAIVVLAGTAVIAIMRGRQADEAVGILSSETKKRDTASSALGSEAELSGKQVERAAALDRKASSQQLVLAADSAPPAPYVPPDPEVIGVSRRQFFNRSIVLMMQIGLGGFGAACIAFLWPQLGGGFGSAIKIGLVSDLLADIRSNNGFLYKAEGRMWLTEYPNGAVEKARAAYSAPELAGMEAGLTLGLDGGILALYQKCPHLGCRVPECGTSQWFECPCHGSQYNRVGEKRGGPAPRGMDRFAMSIGSDGSLTVNTGAIVQGPPIGTNTTGQEAEGPNCIGQSSH
ncbi:MAG: ubiquinol-cytochrome c reductase iron-sulfur subunit [Acidimicrobiaceae bacterium]|jgi:cytochrome b6-f complex iron-sulfur subunit|nr:ubiquinol-cytochrome c reductase iron-sulfur subunit [Acidimicrobiaceae bacterium]MBT7351390.1 ubiquinol-cytochrome c reductase iron-sulfur subunit [Phycisphaerae bacterium]MDG1409636.1 ubiquinol-cytochrome c reductase iron-sulfur subunit [Acidimicrobiales bacterium]MBT5579223.1 ubiquinol-cytochrome c reductase iron-sulfur subunit [Acidimicrobiaceae bacterium]MBT5849756.1 ubiquinol-cytochrome c reductase iron-sulfur subunit [Acidimicrobiaceae bacterium]